MSVEPQPGGEIGGYRLETKLGEGGMGTVFLATRSEDGRRAALKIPHSELAAEVTFQQRFEREARYAASIDHPSIIEVFDAGEHDGIPYMAMRYVPGVDLKEVLARDAPLEPDRAMAVLRQVAGALDAAHAEGLLHRDVKPGNVMIASGEGDDPPGHAFVTDFGLAKNPGADSIALTADGQFVGTTDYVAPEQITGNEFDHRVDVYAFGCVLFECLTGRLPFERDRELEVMYAHIQDPPPPITQHRPDLPPAIDDVIARALEKKPENRFGSCTELIEAAAGALGASPPSELARERAGEELAAGGRLVLEVVAGPAAGAVLDVADELVFGREGPASGQLAGDREISRQHARVFRGESGELVIEDLGSTNGTYVNGARIEGARPIGPGDRIGLGRTLIEVRATADASPQAATPSAPVDHVDSGEVSTDVSVAAPAPPPAGEAPEAPPLTLSLDFEPTPREIRLRISGSDQEIRLVRDGDGWRLA